MYRLRSRFLWRSCVCASSSCQHQVVCTQRAGRTSCCSAAPRRSLLCCVNSAISRCCLSRNHAAARGMSHAPVDFALEIGLRGVRRVELLAPLRRVTASIRDAHHPPRRPRRGPGPPVQPACRARPAAPAARDADAWGAARRASSFRCSFAALATFLSESPSTAAAWRVANRAGARAAHLAATQCCWPGAHSASGSPPPACIIARGWGKKACAWRGNLAFSFSSSALSSPFSSSSCAASTAAPTLEAAHRLRRLEQPQKVVGFGSPGVALRST